MRGLQNYICICYLLHKYVLLCKLFVGVNVLTISTVPSWNFGKCIFFWIQLIWTIRKRFLLILLPWHLICRRVEVSFKVIGWSFIPYVSNVEWILHLRFDWILWLVLEYVQVLQRKPACERIKICEVGYHARYFCPWWNYWLFVCFIFYIFFFLFVSFYLFFSWFFIKSKILRTHFILELWGSLNWKLWKNIPIYICAFCIQYIKNYDSFSCNIF